MKARYFTYGEKPKAVFYLTDIKRDMFPNSSIEEFYKEIEEKWLTNNDIVLIDDRETSYSTGELETVKIEEYLNKLEQLKNYFDNDDI